MSIDDQFYQSCYCEENIYHLARLQLEDSSKNVFNRQNHIFIVFISNAKKCVPIWQQKKGCNNQPVVWDYHVILLCKSEMNNLIYDYDSKLEFPTPALDYITKCFEPSPEMDISNEFMPYFKIIKSDEFLNDFASDRRHMKKNIEDDGTFLWSATPPSWQCIQGSNAAMNSIVHNLNEYIDTTTTIKGENLNLDQFKNFIT